MAQGAKRPTSLKIILNMSLKIVGVNILDFFFCKKYFFVSLLLICILIFTFGHEKLPKKLFNVEQILHFDQKVKSIFFSGRVYKYFQ